MSDDLSVEHTIRIIDSAGHVTIVTVFSSGIGEIRLSKAGEAVELSWTEWGEIQGHVDRFRPDDRNEAFTRCGYEWVSLAAGIGRRSCCLEAGHGALGAGGFDHVASDATWYSEESF
jgi:hypothetical protein